MNLLETLRNSSRLLHDHRRTLAKRLEQDNAKKYESARKTYQAELDRCDETLASLRLEIFKIEACDIVMADELSHVTSGHPVSPRTLHVYRRDDASPTGCFGCATHPDTPEAREVLHRLGVSVGGLGGNRGTMS